VRAVEITTPRIGGGSNTARRRAFDVARRPAETSPIAERAVRGDRIELVRPSAPFFDRFLSPDLLGPRPLAR